MIVLMSDLKWGNSDISCIMTKLVFRGSDQVQHKQGCTATDDG